MSPDWLEPFKMLSPHDEDVITKTHTDEMQCFYLGSLPFSARTAFSVLTHLIWVTTPGGSCQTKGMCTEDKV